VCGDLFYAKVPELGFWAVLGQFSFLGQPSGPKIRGILKKKGSTKKWTLQNWSLILTTKILATQKIGL